MDPIYGDWPRTPYSCGPDDDGLGHNRSNYPYQELVFGCAANPPVVDGEPLWSRSRSPCPTSTTRASGSPLSLDNFVFPYSHMDILTPQPFHIDQTPAPDPALRDKVLGQPQLALNTDNVTVENDRRFRAGLRLRPHPQHRHGRPALLRRRVGAWVTVLPYTGVAVGLDMPCAEDSPCDRFGHIGFIVWPKDMPPGVDSFQIVVQALGHGQSKVINVNLGLRHGTGPRSVSGPGNPERLSGCHAILD